MSNFESNAFVLGSLLVAYINLRDNEAARYMDSDIGEGFSSVPEVCDLLNPFATCD